VRARPGRFEQRIERLEQRMGVKPGPRLIYLMPNLEPDEPEETPYLVKLSSDVWAHVFGAPLSDVSLVDRPAFARAIKQHRAERGAKGFSCGGIKA